MATDHDLDSDVSKMQLPLAEKRTALSVMRTGIMLFSLPLSVITLLVATSRYYDVATTLHLLLPLLSLCVLLMCLAVFLVARSVWRMTRLDRLMNEFKGRDEHLADLMV